MMSLLKRGSVIPSFTLPNTEGQPLRRTFYRGVRHLVLVFFRKAGGDAARSYLRALADGYTAMRHADGEVLVVLNDQATATEVKHALALPFPVLVDAGGRVTGKFLPQEMGAAVLVTDRYGELYYEALAGDARELPPVAELQAWLEAIDRQCVI